MVVLAKQDGVKGRLRKPGRSPSYKTIARICRTDYSNIAGANTHKPRMARKETQIEFKRIYCISCLRDDAFKLGFCYGSRVARCPLWQDSWHYLIFSQLGGSGVDNASLFR